jgi:hypothetical protein
MALDGIGLTVRIGLVTGLKNKTSHYGKHMAEDTVLSISYEKN